MSEKQSVARALTKSSLPLYKTLLLNRPLPTSLGRAAAANRPRLLEDLEHYQFEDAQRESHRDDSTSAEDSDQENQDTNQRPGSRSGRNKRHSSRTAGAFSSRQVTNQEPEGQEMARSKNTTAGARAASQESTKRKKKVAKRKKAEEDSDSESEDSGRDEENVEIENKRLKSEVYRLQMATQLSAKNKSGRAKKGTPGTGSAEERETASTTKFWLWKRVKFLKDETQITDATEKVMQKMNLRSLKGLSGNEKINAEQTWIAENRDTVRLVLNYWRNYVQQELHKLMFVDVWVPNSVHDADSVPNADQILKLALRDGIAKNKGLEKMFDFYWDHLMSKVANNASWGPAKRHKELMSTGLQPPPEGPDPFVKQGRPALLVTPSDEAFLVVLWENCYTKWCYIRKQAKAGKDVDKKHKDYQTPHTESKKGVKHYGGWNKAGRKRYRELLDLIIDSKNDHEEIAEVEQAALDRLRIVHDCVEKEAKSKANKNGVVVEVDSDHEADWM